MFNMKKFIRFSLLFPGIYLAALLIYLLAMFSGAGHTPRGLDFLFYFMTAPCYLFDLLLPPGLIHNPILNLIICLALGFLTYALIGALLDVALRKYRDGQRSNAG